MLYPEIAEHKSNIILNIILFSYLFYVIFGYI